MSERMGAEHYGEERAETAEAEAELIIAEELKRGRWQEADLNCPLLLLLGLRGQPRGRVTQRMSEGILHFGAHAKIQPSPGQRTGAVYTIQGSHHLAAWSP
jgi:hypothetical protein